MATENSILPISRCVYFPLFNPTSFSWFLLVPAPATLPSQLPPPCSSESDPSLLPRSLTREDGGPGAECRHLQQLLVRRVGEICREVNQVRAARGGLSRRGHSSDEDGVSRTLTFRGC